MIDKRLDDVLHGREGNYLLPFYWQRGGHRDRIPAQIARIRASGCRALCVEARPHPDFAGEGWWRDMGRILAECERLGMKVWILDDRHYPTGYANRLVETERPELRPWMLVERHLDAMGPMDGATFLLDPSSDEEPLVGAYAFRRAAGGGQRLEGEPVDLGGLVRGGSLCWDVPEGCWRVFFLYKSRRGGDAARIDFISAASCALQIEAVYEPHHARFGRYFGNVVAGFFSDEPQFGNRLAGQHMEDRGIYERRIGQEGLALPWNGRVLEMMSAEMGADAAPRLGELWYESPRSHVTRLAYMNAVTRLYRDCFARPVGEWCRAHGVAYVGHVIEDMNAHGRLGVGAGHYFRAIDSQDMGGVDIVLHQVLPGFANDMHAAFCEGGAVDPAFFHYVLAKLAASISHQVPRMKGRAMCEVFGAYGWGEGAPTMKWLVDFLLVRGVNHFVPHAFSPDYPDPDCPPHFGADGHDPQFDGFSAVMGYANKMAHLLTGGRHVAAAAILYHAEGEWMSGYGKAMLMQEPAKALYDAHLDFDIVCCDTLLGAARVDGGRLSIGEETFGALVVPAAEHLPAALVAQLAAFRKAGLCVLFAGGVPRGVEAEATPVDGLADAVRAAAGADVSVDGDFPLLRVYHIVRDGHDVFFFANESFTRAARTTARLPVRGDFARLRLLEDFAASDATVDGAVPLDLLPGQSELLVFGAAAGLPAARMRGAAKALHPAFTLEVAESDDLAAFRPYAAGASLFNVNAPDRLPGFSGKMRYRFTLDLDSSPGAEGAALDLGRVGETARLWVNGADAGIRVAEPYCFEVGPLLRKGPNEIVVEVANTLAQKVRDRFSFYLPIRPAGLLGPLSLLR